MSFGAFKTGREMCQRPKQIPKKMSSAPDTLRECREILGDLPGDQGAHSRLIQRCSDILGVLLSCTRSLCEKAKGPQTAAAKFELLTGTDALFRGIDVEHRAVRAAIPDVDEVMKKIAALRKSPGFRKMMDDVLHGVLVEQDVDWVMLPLLRELVAYMEELEELVRPR